MAYGITSSSQIIDIGTISNGCTQLEETAKKFEECAKLVLEASSICDANALSVDQTTIQPQLEVDAEFIRSIKDAVDGFASGIRNVATQIYAAQSQELEDYIASQQSTNNG